MLSIAKQSKRVRISVWLGIAIGAGLARTAVEKQLRQQIHNRLKFLAEEWEIFE